MANTEATRSVTAAGSKEASDSAKTPEAPGGSGPSGTSGSPDTSSSFEANTARDGRAGSDGSAGSHESRKRGAQNKPGKQADSASDLAGLEAGLDALDSETAAHTSLGRIMLTKVFPPLVAIVLVLFLWQLAFTLNLKEDYQLPSPLQVGGAIGDLWLKGTLFEVIWTSVSRGLLGFVIAIAIGTPLGLLVGKVRFVRAAIGPILTGLQSLPSVAWVPAAIIWFGLSDAMIYTVILLGAVPSIANGLVSGLDQVPPLYQRAGRVIGATGFAGVRHVLLPASLPGYLAGLKQGWAFSWRSLMAAEIIARSPDLGAGLGQLLENGRGNQDMAMVLSAILLILVVGIAIDLLVFAPLERRVLRSRGLLVNR